MALVPSLVDDWKLKPWEYDYLKWDPWELDLYDHWKRIDRYMDCDWPYYNRDYWNYPYRYRSRWSPVSTTTSAIDDAKEIWSSIGQHGFHVDIDVHVFRPYEVTVRTTVDNYVVIEGKHEAHPTRNHHVRKHFMKKYALPAGFNSRDVTSAVSKDGVLTVKCLPPLRPLPNVPRHIPIDYK